MSLSNVGMVVAVQRLSGNSSEVVTLVLVLKSSQFTLNHTSHFISIFSMFGGIGGVVVGPLTILQILRTYSTFKITLEFG